MKHIGIGIVGIGFGQNVHLPAFRADPRARVVAIAASSVERARAAADKLAIPAAYGDWRALCTDPAVAVVAISVPPALQPQIALAAIAAGKHILCEKPLANSLEDAQRIASAARDAGLIGAVDFEFPQIPAWQTAREVCVRRRLGRLRQVAITWHIETYAYRRGAPSGAVSGVVSWKLDAARGGGTINLFVSHTVQCIEWMLGQPIARVCARLSPVGAPAEARVHGWFELADGTPVTITVAADAFAGTGHRWEIYGDDGTMLLENPGADYVNGFSVRVADRVGGDALTRVDQTLTDVPADGRVYAVSKLVGHFLDVIDGTGPAAAVPSLDDGVKVQRVLDLMRQSDREGRWLS
jgi:predicted dehydrogenase